MLIIFLRSSYFCLKSSTRLFTLFRSPSRRHFSLFRPSRCLRSLAMWFSNRALTAVWEVVCSCRRLHLVSSRLFSCSRKRTYGEALNISISIYSLLFSLWMVIPCCSPINAHIPEGRFPNIWILVISLLINTETDISQPLFILYDESGWEWFYRLTIQKKRCVSFLKLITDAVKDTLFGVYDWKYTCSLVERSSDCTGCEAVTE